MWCKFFQNEQKESRRWHTLKHFERQAWDHLPISAGLSFQLLLSRAHLMVTWKKYFSCVLFAGSFLSFASVFWVSSPCTSGMPQVRVGLQKRTAGWWWWWRGGGGVLDLPSHTEPGGCRLLRRWRAQALCVHVFFLPRPKMPLGKIALSSLWPSSSQLPVVVSAVHRSSLLFHVWPVNRDRNVIPPPRTRQKRQYSSQTYRIQKIHKCLWCCQPQKLTAGWKISSQGPGFFLQWISS